MARGISISHVDDMNNWVSSTFHIAMWRGVKDFQSIILYIYSRLVDKSHTKMPWIIYSHISRLVELIILSLLLILYAYFSILRKIVGQDTCTTIIKCFDIDHRNLPLILGIWCSTIPHLPGCFCPWAFFQNIGFNVVPSDPFMSHLATQLGYSAGEFQALQLIVLATFGVVDYPLASCILAHLLEIDF